jgi:peptidoglycan/LPS O-acetylase OafA/YrhL
MGQLQLENPRNNNRYEPCLAGVRGYGFLLVFCAHYLRPDRLAHPDTVLYKVLIAVSSLGVFAVPAFFVLSGYLIGGILYHTRNRQGYFKVFYFRRILRVFPVYYITLLVIAAFFAIRHLPLDKHFWIQFLYIQNLAHGYAQQPSGPVVMMHFWSLAVEEQFYLLWPLVVWFLPDRRKLIGAVTALIAVCCVARLAAPLIYISAPEMTSFTLTRADAILLGVLLNLICESAIYRQLIPYAKWVTLCGLATIVLLAFYKGASWALTYAGKEVWIPLANFTAAAIIVAVMERGSVLNRLCSQRWVCWLGALSYSLYVFHLTFSHFFLYYLTPRFETHMRHSLALLASVALAFCTTLILSLLSYFLIEGPLMKLKGHMRYGAEVRSLPIHREVEKPLLAETGT